MSSPFLPFLYQTRTILRTPRTSPRASAAFLRSFHATRCRFKTNDIPFDSEVGEEDIPLEQTPSQRGTITPTERQIFERIFADIKARGLKPSIQHDTEPPPRSEGGDGGDWMGGQTSSASRSAMLIMQQAAHDAGQSRPSHIAAPAILAGAARDRNKALLRFPPELRAAASKALNAIDPRSSSSSSSSSTAPAPASSSEEQPGVDDDQWTAPPHAFMRRIEVEAKRHPERMRVEGLIMAARSDHELWDILEREVFTMPAKLGIGKKTEEEEKEEKEEKERAARAAKAAKKAKRKAQKAGAEGAAATEVSDPHGDAAPHAEAADADVLAGESAESAESEDAESTPIPPEKMSLYIHGPLYPAYLLLALRRLDTAFHAPSALALSVLPRVKELGLESYVLGVSTPFYNELLEIYWSRYGDLTGMLDLLEEMRHCGLYFDSQTSSILGHVQGQLTMLARGKELGSFGAAIMTMPQYERSVRDRIRHWHRAVDISIEQRDEDIGY